MTVSLPQSTLTLRLLGGCELTGPGETPVTALLVQPKRLALFVYLAISLPRGFRRRDEILALFWPESDAEHARNSLRQSLHELRTHLPAGVLLARGNDEIGLCADLVRVDARWFEELLDSGQEEKALALYRGELLPGFHLPGCPDFDMWLEGERERLRRRSVRAALVLAQRLDLDGDTTQAAGWARFAEERAPFDESVLREVLELLIEVGQRAAAVQLREAAAERYRTELGIELSPQIRQIGERAPADRPQLPPGAHQSPRAVLGLRSPKPGATSTPRRAVSAEARELYLQARHAAGQRSPVTIRRALELFEEALRMSPDYAEAHSGLAFALTQATVYVAYPPVRALPKVKAHASKAIRLDSTLVEAHAMLASATICYDYDWQRAEEMYLRAFEIEPRSEVLCCSYALYYLTSVGRLDEALAILDRARDSMPTLLGISTFCGMACAFGGRFERAKREADTVITLEPGFVQAHWVRGMALEGLGDFSAAIETFERGASLTDGSSLMLSQLGRARARAGDPSGAEAILSELERRSESTGPAAYFTAEILAALGRHEAAIDRLYAAYRERNPLLIFAGVFPGLNPLRGERRFRELLLRIGLRTQRSAA